MKRKILFAAVALFCAVGSWAQSPNPGDDMTSYITNPNAATDTNGWTTTNGKAHRHTGNGFDGSAGFFELCDWENTWDLSFSQTIDNLPNGYYLVKAAGQMSASDLWMKLSANGYESYFSANGSTQGNILANGTETEIGNGVAGWRYNSVVTEVTDGSLEIIVRAKATVKNRWANFDNVTLTYLCDAPSASSPVDLTGLLKNASLDNGSTDWTCDGGGTFAQKIGTNNKGRGYEFYHGSRDLHQSLSSMPNGNYQVSVQATWRDAQTTQLYATTASGTSTQVINQLRIQENPDDKPETQIAKMYDDASWGRISVDVNVSDGNLTVGLKEPSNGCWAVFDNFRILYYGSALLNDAVALPEGGAMAADTWYYFDIAAAADNYVATATTLGDIICTSDGTQLTASATGDVTLKDTDNSLSAGRYYVKSSSANNLGISVASYTYTVGAATPSFADGSYVSTFTTVDFAFTNAGSNAPGAVFEILDNEATASLKVGGSEVATGSLSLTGTTLTATFNTEISRSTTYTIEIAAGVVGYEGQETNAAISTTIKTGIIADGVYYFKRNGTETYLTRGGLYGTEAVTDKFGISFEVLIQTDGSYYLKNVDHSLVNSSNIYLNAQYTDQGAYNWTIEATEGGYVLKRPTGEYITTSEEAEFHYNFITNAADKASAIVWTLMNKTEYRASLASRKNSEATAIATAAGIDGVTSEATLVSTLAANYSEVDKTSSITNASLADNADGWTAVSYNSKRRNQAGEEGSKYDVVRFNGGAEVWNYVGGAEQKISDLPEGIYKVTVKSVWRIADNTDATRAGDEANITAWMYATSNGVTDYTQLKNWYDNQPANNAAIKNSTNDDFVNTVYVYVAEGEDLTIGIASPSWCGTPWMPFAGWTLTYYTDGPVKVNKDYIIEHKGDVTGLINGNFTENADGWTGGSRITGLARGWNSSSEANPFYERSENGTMSYTLSNMPAGTYKVVAASRTYAGGKMKAQVAGGEYGTEITGIGDARPNPEDGTPEINLNGVEMPYSSLGGFTTNNLGHNWHWITATGTLDSDGDLVINFEATGAGWMPIDDVHLYCTELDGVSYTRTVGDGKGTINANNYVVTADIIMENPNTILRSTGKVQTAAGQDLNNNQYNSARITKLVLYDGYDFANSNDNYGLDYGATLYRNIPADTWCTLMVPFYPENLDVKKIPTTLDGSDVLHFTDAPSTDINDVPMLVKSTEGVTAITGVRNSTHGITKGTSVAGTDNIMQGTYSAIANLNEVDGTNYVVARAKDASTDAIYRVNSTVSLAPFRAYFTIDEGAGVKANVLSMNFDELPTAIESVDKVESVMDATIYNLAGQRLNKVQKGVNIINGKKVLVK